MSNKRKTTSETTAPRRKFKKTLKCSMSEEEQKRLSKYDEHVPPNRHPEHNTWQLISISSPGILDLLTEHRQLRSRLQVQSSFAQYMSNHLPISDRQNYCNMTEDFVMVDVKEVFLRTDTNQSNLCIIASLTDMKDTVDIPVTEKMWHIVAFRELIPVLLRMVEATDVLTIWGGKRMKSKITGDPYFLNLNGEVGSTNRNCTILQLKQEDRNVRDELGFLKPPSLSDDEDIQIAFLKAPFERVATVMQITPKVKSTSVNLPGGFFPIISQSSISSGSCLTSVSPATTSTNKISQFVEIEEHNETSSSHDLVKSRPNIQAHPEDENEKCASDETIDVSPHGHEPLRKKRKMSHRLGAIRDDKKVSSSLLNSSKTMKDRNTWYVPSSDLDDEDDESFCHEAQKLLKSKSIKSGNDLLRGEVPQASTVDPKLQIPVRQYRTQTMDSPIEYPPSERSDEYPPWDASCEGQPHLSQSENSEEVPNPGDIPIQMDIDIQQLSQTRSDKAPNIHLESQILNISQSQPILTRSQNRLMLLESEVLVSDDIEKNVDENVAHKSPQSPSFVKNCHNHSLESQILDLNESQPSLSQSLNADDEVDHIPSQVLDPDVEPNDNQGLSQSQQPQISNRVNMNLESQVLELNTTQSEDCCSELRNSSCPSQPQPADVIDNSDNIVRLLPKSPNLNIGNIHLESQILSPDISFSQRPFSNAVDTDDGVPALRAEELLERGAIPVIGISNETAGTSSQFQPKSIVINPQESERSSSAKPCVENVDRCETGTPSEHMDTLTLSQLLSQELGQPTEFNISDFRIGSAGRESRIFKTLSQIEAEDEFDLRCTILKVYSPSYDMPFGSVDVGYLVVEDGTMPNFRIGYPNALSQHPRPLSDLTCLIKVHNYSYILSIAEPGTCVILAGVRVEKTMDGDLELVMNGSTEGTRRCVPEEEYDDAEEDLSSTQLIPRGPQLPMTTGCRTTSVSVVGGTTAGNPGRSRNNSIEHPSVIIVKDEPIDLSSEEPNPSLPIALRLRSRSRSGSVLQSEISGTEQEKKDAELKKRLGIKESKVILKPLVLKLL